MFYHIPSHIEVANKLVEQSINISVTASIAKIFVCRMSDMSDTRNMAMFNQLGSPESIIPSPNDSDFIGLATGS